MVHSPIEFNMPVLLMTDGYVFPLERDVVTVGRAPDNDLALRSSGVSRHHCELRRSWSRYEIRDRGSVNRVRVNGWPLERKFLGDGDVIELGTAVMFFRSPTYPNHPWERPEEQLCRVAGFSDWDLTHLVFGHREGRREFDAWRDEQLERAQARLLRRVTDNPTDRRWCRRPAMPLLEPDGAEDADPAMFRKLPRGR